MHFTALNFIRIIEIRDIKVQEKIPHREPIQKSVRRNVWENARFYAPLFVLLLLSFPRVSMPYEAKESGSGQSG